MTVTPVQARCTRCRGDFALAELLDRRDGRCPRCGWRLTEDWAAVLLDEAKRVDVAQKHLAASLRRLRELPGNLVVLPHPVVRNVVDALEWEEPADDDRGTLDDQRKLLTELAGRWARRDDPPHAEGGRRRRRAARHRTHRSTSAALVKER
jgi:hypothetical protein